MQRRRLMIAGLGAGLASGFGALGFWQDDLPAIPIGGSLGQSAPPVFTGADLAFGTTMSIQVAHRDQNVAMRAIDAALAAAKQVDHLMSLHRDDSQIMRLNRTGMLMAPDPHVLAVLGYCQTLSRLTRGAFDITVQPLWNAYAQAARMGGLPDAETRRQALQSTGWRRIEISADRISIAPGMAITLNGVAQGYAVDLARTALAAHGIDHALIDTGEFGTRGARSARSSWTVGVRHPRDAQALVGAVPMDGRCLATSGDYETFFTPDYLHHHIFDPATGDSPGELASVSVLAPTGLEADGLSTACMVLGRQRVIAELASIPGVDVLLVDKRGEIWRSAGFPVLA